MRFNQPIVGFAAGILAPVLGFLVVFALLHGDQSFGDFWSRMIRDHQLAAKVVSLSLLANAIPFALTSRRLYYFSKGIFIATILFALLIVFLKFIW